jgi:hypothetical protein
MGGIPTNHMSEVVIPYYSGDIPPADKEIQRELVRL